MTRVPPHVPAPSSGYHVLPVRTIALIGLIGSSRFSRTLLSRKPATRRSTACFRLWPTAPSSRRAGRPEVHKLNPSVQAAVINQVTVAARPLAAVPGTDPERLFQTEVDNLARLATSASLGKLAPDDQRLVLRAAAHDPFDTKIGSAIRSLLSDPDFSSLKPEEKTAVLSQVANYPDGPAINNINRMLAKDWFRDQELG
jgi:hypothetical protein